MNTKFLLFKLLCLASLCISFTGFAQSTTINTTVGSTGYIGTNNDGNNSSITFTMQNNSGVDIELTDVGRWSDAGYNGSTNTLWYSSTSLSGPPGALATPVWNNIATGTPTGLGATLQVNPVITGMTFTIPNGATYRFALHTTATNHYSGGTSSPTPNNFTAGGVTLTTGDFQIAGQNVGYGGANTPRFFTGFVIFKPKATPCTGTPSNAVVNGPADVCPNKMFTLSVGLSNGLQLSGLTHQWQFSTNGTTWANLPGTPAANGNITDAITVPTWYRCNIKCIASGQSFITPAKKVDITPFYYCYCTGSAATATGGSDIGNMKITGFPAGATLLNNGTATPVLSNAGSNKTYSDFRYTVPPIPMYHDSSYLLTVSQILSTATFSAATAAVYIDYNRNGKFDTWERVLLETTNQLPSTAGVVRDTFTMPDTAGYGLTGMRVILRSGTAAPDTCTSYTDGETEDYLVDIRYVPCSGKPNAGTITGDTSMCIDYDYILTDSTYERFKHGLSRAWQLSADGIHWHDIAGSGGKDTLARLFTGQPLFYQVRAICSHTNDTSFSPVHKVNLKPTYKCYCHSQATGGMDDTSDVGGFRIYNFEITDGGAHLGNPRAVRKRQDFTDMEPIEMWVDSLYNFHVYHTMPYNNHSDAKITVFADFNNNHTYDIPEERIYTGFTNVGYHTLLGNVVIPNAAIVDKPTGLRVIVNNNVGPNVPSDEGCGTYVSGETEDYMVIFRRPFNVSVKHVKEVEDIRLYPNPTSGKLNLQFTTAADARVELKLMTVTGQEALNYIYSHSGGRFIKEIDLSAQAKGVYILEINAAGARSVHKLVLQ